MSARKKRATLREATCPSFDPYERRFVLSSSLLGYAAWSLVEKLLGSDYLVELDDMEIGTITASQLYWIANAPYDDLVPHNAEIYKVIEALGQIEMIPIDNRRRAEREKVA